MDNIDPGPVEWDLEKVVEQYRKKTLSGNPNFRYIKTKLDAVEWSGFTPVTSIEKNEKKLASISGNSGTVDTTCDNISGWKLTITGGNLIKGLNSIIKLPLDKRKFTKDVLDAFDQSVYVDPGVSVVDKTTKDSVTMISTHFTQGTPPLVEAKVSTKNIHYRGCFSGDILVYGGLGGKMDVAITEVCSEILRNEVEYQFEELPDPPKERKYTETSKGLPIYVKFPIKGHVDFYVSSEAKIEWIKSN